MKHSEKMTMIATISLAAILMAMVLVMLIGLFHDKVNNDKEDSPIKVKKTHHVPFERSPTKRQKNYNMYVKEYNWQHYELLIGLERNTKLNTRRRVRIGIYGVISDGNKIAPTTAWKISFAMLDDRSMKWNF